MPVQRGNYGLPPRPTAVPAPAQPRVQPVAPAQPVAQPTPQPAFQAAPPQPTATPAPKAGQFMDFAPSRPRVVQPLPNTQQPLPPLQPTPAPQPIAPSEPTPQPVPAAEPAAQRPLFTPTNSVAEAPKKKVRRQLPKLRLAKVALLVIGILLLVTGAGRWISAGSTANDTIAVGAVSANDGREMTIQFTATDGKLHKINTKSNRDFIPGTAVEMAYRSGAPEATARQVGIVKANRNLGITIVLGGVVSLLAYAGVRGVASLQEKRKNKHRAVPLSAAATV